MDRRGGMGRREFLQTMAAAGLGMLAGGWLGGRLLAPSAVPSKAAPSGTAPSGTALSGTAWPALNVVDYGADPTGAKDSSDAFRRAMRDIARAVRANPAAAAVGDANRRGRARLYVPEGCYVVAEPESLLSRDAAGRALGLVIQGAGRGLTQIYYRNSRPGRYLMYNRDSWMGMTVADIEFVSDQPVNNFLYSYSEGGAQNATFERCMWTGKWNDVFRLEGTNNNSEMTWYHCNFNGSFRTGVYVPAAEGSDQFLNYNFFACQFEAAEGDYLVFEKGGNINVWGGSLIHYGEHKGGTFFRLLGGSHAMGVQRFLCAGARFEHRNADSRLIECEWNDGTVTFLSCDMSSQAFRLEPFVNAVFRSINEKMPAVAFIGCLLMGRHEYRYLVDSWRAQHQIVYENCEFAHALGADDFIVYTPESRDDQAGGRPPVVFRHCRSLSGGAETSFFDSDYGARFGSRALLTPKLLSVKDPRGSLPAAGEAETFRLPLGAVVLNVKFWCAPGAAHAEGAADYWIETDEPQPRRLASVFAARAADGFEADVNLIFECDDPARTAFRLRAGPNTAYPNRAACCLIQYIG